VAGTINGVAATGSGQTLTSDVGNSIGLSILISGGLLGNRGSASYSHGYAYSLDKALTSMLATNGSLDGRTQGINNTIKDIGKQRDALNVRLAEIETRYRTQFTALDSMLSSMNQTSTYLTQQFDIMQSQTKNF
jgi:flagellar hook-associated protein 2